MDKKAGLFLITVHELMPIRKHVRLEFQRAKSLRYELLIFWMICHLISLELSCSNFRCRRNVFFLMWCFLVKA